MYKITISLDNLDSVDVIEIMVHCGSLKYVSHPPCLFQTLQMYERMFSDTLLVSMSK